MRMPHTVTIQKREDIPTALKATKTAYVDQRCADAFVVRGEAKVSEQGGKRVMIRQSQVFFDEDVQLTNLHRIAYEDDMGVQRFITITSYTDLAGRDRVWAAKGTEVG